LVPRTVLRGAEDPVLEIDHSHLVPILRIDESMSPLPPYFFMA
jgi:hypothetical protein